MYIVCNSDHVPCLYVPFSLSVGYKLLLIPFSLGMTLDTEIGSKYTLQLKCKKTMVTVLSSKSCTPK